MSGSLSGLEVSKHRCTGKARVGWFRILLLSVFFVFITADRAEAYIGPGAGFAVVGSFLVMFTALLSGIVALLTWPIRWIWRSIRGRRAYARSRVKRFVVLGLDGMDPSLTEKFLSEGKLPNFSRLRQEGCFKRLGTSIPPISPVAWSSFQTCSNPGKHNIFDFLTVNKQTYQPQLSSVDIRGPGRTLNFGKYQVPLGKSDIRLLRKGKSFWKVLGEHGVFSSIIRVPITFPPEKFHGVLLSAMCVPDLRGSQGTFSFYTTANHEDSEHTGGERYVVTSTNGRIKAELTGPENPFRSDGNILKCPFVVTLDDEGSAATVKICGQRFKLKEGVYSDWIKIDFKVCFGIKVRGICRFLLLGTKPEFKLYVTPINIDPEKPAMPIAHPAIYSTYLAKRQGAFATLGLAEDTWALNEKILSDRDFIEQCLQTDDEREKMFFDALDKLRRGLCVCVFDGTDRIQHTFWRGIDEQHPAHDAQDEGPAATAVEEVYKRMDGLVGRAMGKCDDKDTVLMVVSDHGFNTFRYGVDLNRWLEQNGYLKVKEGERDKKHMAGIDWSQTRAFGLGLAGVFLNLKGRLPHGIVDPGKEAMELRKEIAQKLSGLKDESTGQVSIKQVYIAQEIYTGPYKNESPDLIVGYEKGYRACWEMAIGQVTEGVFHLNAKAWSGDHCIDHTLVPGVLFCNRSVNSEHPRLMDIGATVLDMFGIEMPGYMDGKALTVADADGSKSCQQQAKQCNGAK